MSLKEEREFGQEVMEQILTETGDAEVDGKAARSFKTTKQKQQKKVENSKPNRIEVQPSFGYPRPVYPVVDSALSEPNSKFLRREVGK